MDELFDDIDLAVDDDVFDIDEAVEMLYEAIYGKD
jgi:hypothetical protein